MREIDVLVETPAGLYTLKIAVEVKDEKRKLGPQVVEEYVGKYQPGSGIPMNQVVLVSKSGFTRSAKDRAQAANMLLMTISDAKHADWRKFISPKVPQVLTFEMQPHFHARHILPPVPDGGERVWLDGRLCCTCCGRDHGTPKDVLDRSLQKDFWSKPELKRELDEALVEHDGNALATVRVPITRCAVHFEEHIYPIRELVAEIHFCRASGPLQFQTFELEDSSGGKRTFQRARARVAGKSFELLLPDGTASDRIILDVRTENTRSPTMPPPQT
jgi:hypothetical protein